MTSASDLQVFRAEGRYGVNYNGSPLMASTTEPERALGTLDRWLANFAERRTRYTLSFWDGDKGIETPCADDLKLRALVLEVTP